MSTNSLGKKVAVISGGSSGIGLAIAKILDSQGVSLILIGNDEGQLDSVANEFKTPPLNIVGDIADSKISERAIVEGLSKFGSVDIVIANAGIYLTKDGWSVPGTQIDAVVGVNISGVMHLTHAAINHFLKVGGGDIVVTSSVAGLVDVPHEAVYSATKHAVTSFVNSTRHRLAGKNIRIGSIEPGIVQTPLWVTKAESTGVAVPDIIKNDRALKAEDVANAVLFMLTQPRHVNIRDVVLLPTDQPF